MVYAVETWMYIAQYQNWELSPQERNLMAEGSALIFCFLKF